jgi:hypothetical protein
MFLVGYTDGGAPFGYVEWNSTGLDASFPDDEGWIASEDGVEPF